MTGPPRTHSLLPHARPAWAKRHGLAWTKRTTIDRLTGHRCRRAGRRRHRGTELRRTRSRFGLILLLQTSQNVGARRHDGPGGWLSGKGTVRRGRRKRVIELSGRRGRSHAIGRRELSRGTTGLGSTHRGPTDRRTRNGRSRRRPIGLILTHRRTRDGWRTRTGGRTRSARRSDRGTWRFWRQRRTRTLGGSRGHSATGSGWTAYSSGSILRRPLRRPGERGPFEWRTRHTRREGRGRATLRSTGQSGGGGASSWGRWRCGFGRRSWDDSGKRSGRRRRRRLYRNRGRRWSACGWRCRGLGRRRHDARNWDGGRTTRQGRPYRHRGAHRRDWNRRHSHYGRGFRWFMLHRFMLDRFGLH